MTLPNRGRSFPRSINSFGFFSGSRTAGSSQPCLRDTERRERRTIIIIDGGILITVLEMLLLRWSPDLARFILCDGKLAFPESGKIAAACNSKDSREWEKGRRWKFAMKAQRSKVPNKPNKLRRELSLLSQPRLDSMGCRQITHDSPQWSALGTGGAPYVSCLQINCNLTCSVGVGSAHQSILIPPTVTSPVLSFRGRAGAGQGRWLTCGCDLLAYVQYCTSRSNQQ